MKTVLFTICLSAAIVFGAITTEPTSKPTTQPSLEGAKLTPLQIHNFLHTKIMELGLADSTITKAQRDSGKKLLSKSLQSFCGHKVIWKAIVLDIVNQTQTIHVPVTNDTDTGKKGTITGHTTEARLTKYLLVITAISADDQSVRITAETKTTSKGQVVENINKGTTLRISGEITEIAGGGTPGNEYCNIRLTDCDLLKDEEHAPTPTTQTAEGQFSLAVAYHKAGTPTMLQKSKELLKDILKDCSDPDMVAKVKKELDKVEEDINGATTKVNG